GCAGHHCRHCAEARPRVAGHQHSEARRRRAGQGPSHAAAFLPVRGVLRWQKLLTLTMTISSHSPPYSRCQHDLVRLAIDHNQVPEVAHQLAMTISTLRRAQPQPSDVLDEALQWFLVKTWNFGVEQHAQ